MKEFDSLIKKVKNKEFLPVYFFHGEEPYYTDELTQVFENEIIPEEERSFGQTVVYGRDTTLGEVMALAQQMPMFGTLNLIIVKEAQDLKFEENETKALENYIENPLSTTLLVFAYKHKKIDARKKFAKALQKSGMLFYSEPVKDYQLGKWISEKLQEMRFKTAPNISNLLAEYLGNDLSRIQNELNKLKIILKEDEILDETVVEKHIGISKEFNIFELQKALGMRDQNRAMRIAHFIAQNPKSNPLPMMMGSLYTYFSNLIIYQTMNGQPPNTIAEAMGVNPYFLKDYAQAAAFYPLKYATRIISILRETDMKTKGLGANATEDGELLIEMVYKILNIGQLKVAT